MTNTPPYTSEALAAYQEVRDQVRHDDHRDPDALITALEVLTRTGVFAPIEKVLEAETWTTRPEHGRIHHPLAQQIRPRRKLGGIRLGATEFYAIVAETTEWLIIGIWGADGYWRGEMPVARREFDQKYERKE